MKNKFAYLLLAICLVSCSNDNGTTDYNKANKLKSEYIQSVLKKAPKIEDVNKSIKLLQSASEKGNRQAQRELGEIYYKGKFFNEKKNLLVAQNYTKAADLLKNSGNMGDTRAAHILGWMYISGQGVEKSKTKAAKWFSLIREDNYYWQTLYFVPDNHSNSELEMVAAELGDPRAQYLVAVGYLYVPFQNQNIASKWFEKSAKGGYSNAQFEIGTRYSLGNGVLKDYIKAYMWLNIAHYNQYKAAEIGLNDLADEMSNSAVVKAQEAAHICLESSYKNCL